MPKIPPSTSSGSFNPGGGGTGFARFTLCGPGNEAVEVFADIVNEVVLGVSSGLLRPIGPGENERPLATIWGGFPAPGGFGCDQFPGFHILAAFREVVTELSAVVDIPLYLKGIM